MKLTLLIVLLFTAVMVHAQVREHRFVVNMSQGDTTISLTNVTGFVNSSWQMTATDFDSATATFNLQKSNNNVDFGDVPTASVTFVSGASVRFIEFANPTNNTAYRLQIVANTVTAGKIIIDLNTIR